MSRTVKNCDKAQLAGGKYMVMFIEMKAWHPKRHLTTEHAALSLVLMLFQKKVVGIQLLNVPHALAVHS